ncbi:hypothetical protein [Mammaliicoccus sciuri]|uniref:Uncharacterized protein n=1 Tax=Mammaliicoccus sciuri TaxID=1296 RepID=A0AAI8DJM4_MAMSC|nr:hypothetical protein [Mammaliicoccus sciuri]ASE35688.1 hypothetical protein CEP64_13795 [Mammaliicoccus sciuri]
MLKGQIKKSNDPKLVKKLGYKLRKAYPLKEIDRLLNMLVEESRDYYDKKQETIDFILEMSILDDETFVSRWESDDVKLNHQESKHVQTDEFDELAKVENSLLFAIVTRDISQDPDVTKDNIEDFKQDYEEAYQYEPEVKSKKHLLKKKEEVLNKTLEEPKEELTEEPKAIESQSFEINQEGQEKLNRIVEILENTKPLEESSESNVSNSKELDISKRHVKDIIPVLIPKYTHHEVKKRHSKDPILQKKYDFIHDRQLEKEQLKETYYFDLEQQLMLKYLELKEDSELKLSQFQSSLMMSDEALNESEEEKRVEIEERRQAFIENEEAKNLEILRRYKEELDLKYQEKVSMLNQELEHKLKDLDQAYEQEVSDHLSNMIDNHELIISDDITNEQKRLDSEIKTNLQNLIRTQEEHLKTKMYDYDKETFQLLKAKIEGFKQEVLREEQAYRDKLHAEAEKLKYEQQLKQEQHHIEETRRQEAKAKEKADQLEIEKEKKSQLELETKKKAQEIELQKLEEKKKLNSLKEEEISVQKELMKTEQLLQSPQYINTKPTSSKSIWTSLILGGLLLSIMVAIIIFTVNMTGKMVAEEEPEKPTFNELLKNRQYQTAMNEYPNKYKSISDTAYKNQDSDGLDVVIETFDDPKTYMYQALLTHDADNIIKTYEKYKGQLNLKNRDLATIGEYMIDENKVKEAKQLNIDLESESLDNKIKEREAFNTYQKAQKEAEAQKEIINGAQK